MYPHLLRQLQHQLLLLHCLSAGLFNHYLPRFLFEVVPPPVAFKQGLEADMMMNFQRVIENQAHMQQQQIAVMVQLFDAVFTYDYQCSSNPLQTVGVGPSATLSGTTHCTVSDAELELHIRSAPVVSATTLSNECLKHLLKVTNTFEKTLLKK